MPPDMTDRSDEGEDDLVAAEFVVGTLPLEERGRARARIATDPTFAARVREWEERLAPMTGAAEPVPPPAHLYAGIESSLFPAAPAARPGLWTNIGFWRGLALTSLLAFIIAAGTLIFYQVVPRPLSQPLVAALDAKGSDVKLVALYNEAKRQLVVRPLSGSPAADRDFELWFIGPDKKAISLGVLPKGGKTADIAVRPALAARFAGGTTLAITDEPLGGSPTGVATGPIVAAGELKSI